MNRRQFTGRLLTALIFITTASSAIFMTGCSVFNDILNWAPVGQAAINSILTVLTGNGILISPGLQAIIGLINAGFTALIAAIKEYQSTTPPPVGTLSKIETAFNDIVDNFKTFLASLNVSSGLLGIITGLAQIVLSTIAAFMHQLPASPAVKNVADKTSSAKVAASAITVTAKKRSASAFKNDFNAVLKSAPAGVTCPPSSYLK